MVDKKGLNNYGGQLPNVTFGQSQVQYVARGGVFHKCCNKMLS